MANKDYRKAYGAATKELESLLQQKKQIESRVISIRKTMNALSTLLQESGDRGWLANMLGALEEESLTDDILAAIVQSTEPMTTTDVHNELKKFSRSVAEHKNPLATINAVLKRLVEQGKARETRKGGRKAWTPKVISLIPQIDPEMLGKRLADTEESTENKFLRAARQWEEERKK